MMESLIFIYKRRLNLGNAHFSYIDHEDAMVATVFKVTLENSTDLILKICSRVGDYLREVYFLKHFAKKLPVPAIVQLLPPENEIDGAILMQCLPGELLKIQTLDEKRCYETGSLLAKIHLERIQGYGDLIDPDHLSFDPRVPFTMKFEEGLEECKEHLPMTLLKNARQYFDQHIALLAKVDGPCIVHRDFRPGNLIVSGGEVQGIIDWSSARAGFAEEDFCPLELEEWHTNTKYKQAFLAGYATVRPVPNYQNILSLLRLSRAIGAIGFTVKRETWQSRGKKVYQFNRHSLETLLSRI